MAEFLQYVIAGLSSGAIYAVIALGWALIFNVSGVLNLAQGEFLMLGGMVFGWLETNTGLPFTLNIALGIGAGVVVGLPALRFHGAYLALVTFAVALAVPQVAKNYPNFTGGTEGLALPIHTGYWLYGVGWSCAAVFLVLAWLLLRARTGRAFRAAFGNHHGS